MAPEPFSDRQFDKLLHHIEEVIKAHYIPVAIAQVTQAVLTTQANQFHVFKSSMHEEVSNVIRNVILEEYEIKVYLNRKIKKSD